MPKMNRPNIPSFSTLQTSSVDVLDRTRHERHGNLEQALASCDAGVRHNLLAKQVPHRGRAEPGFRCLGRKDALDAGGWSVGNGCDLDWMRDQRRQDFTCGDETGRCDRPGKNGRWSDYRDGDGRRRIRSAAIRARRSVRFGLRMVHRAGHGIAMRARTFQSCLEVVGQCQAERCRDGNQDGQLQRRSIRRQGAEAADASSASIDRLPQLCSASIPTFAIRTTAFHCHPT